MTNVVYKYVLQDTPNEQTVTLAKGAKVLRIDFQILSGTFCLWALVNCEASLEQEEDRVFLIIPTGRPVIGNLEYLNTIYLEQTRYVFHAFEVVSI